MIIIGNILSVGRKEKKILLPTLPNQPQCSVAGFKVLKTNLHFAKKS